MGPTRIATSVLAASVAAVGLAGPANATDGITQNAIGTYEFEGKTVGKRTWVANPCVHDAPHCINVTEFSTDDAARTNAHWSADAYWQVGSWIMFVVVPNALECEDGAEHDIRVNYSWDAAENIGWRSYNDAGICGDEAESVATPFSLTRMGPPPPPLPADLALPPAPAEVPPPLPGMPPLPPAAAEMPVPPPAP